jgi:hypothetical protein
MPNVTEPSFFVLGAHDPYLVEGNTRECGQCHSSITIGEACWYRFIEDEHDFCSRTCLERYEELHPEEL